MCKWRVFPKPVTYEDGFGKLTGGFWYGLRALHCLTSQGGWEMKMDIKLANGTNIFLQYEQFKVASAKDKYKLINCWRISGDNY